MRNFKALKIWQKGFDIAVQSFDLVKEFPKEEKFTFSSQITRSAISIPSNIAECSSRKSDKEQNRFLEIAMGSAYELETHLLIAKAIQICNNEKVDKMLSNLEEEQKMIAGFQKTLKANN
jgi:four helix bundle protein